MRMPEPLTRHERIALSLSGGKDSVACVYLLRDFLDRVTVYHGDTGDLLPETVEVVAQIEQMCPRFVRVTTDASGWIDQHGLPSDLVPYGSHPIGRAIGQAKTPLVSRYDCCFQNVMWPLLERIMADGNTLLIRGSKHADMPKLPLANADKLEGVELFYPIEDWNDADVLAYLRQVGAPVSRAYDHGYNSLDCARCPAWWTEGRAAYLRRYHPALFAAYAARLQAVASELHGSLGTLLHETKIAGVSL